MSHRISPEQEMWLAVIRCAFVDAGVKLRDDGGKVSKERAPTSKKGLNERNIAKAQAVRWFRENSPDFRFVCQCAGLDPDWVRNLAHKKLKFRGVQ